MVSIRASQDHFTARSLIAYRNLLSLPAGSLRSMLSPWVAFSSSPLDLNLDFHYSLCLSQNLASIPVSSLSSLPASFSASKVPYFQRQVKSLLHVSNVQAAVPGVGDILLQNEQQKEVVAFFEDGAQEVDRWGAGKGGDVRRGIVSLSLSFSLSSSLSLHFG